MAAPPTRHTIHCAHSHAGWDNNLPPALTIAPGDTVEIEAIDASGGQITPESAPGDVVDMDPARVNLTTGPIRVDGAAPGDALKLTLVDFRPSGWGWTANIPGFGLLTDDFPDPALNIWRYDAVTLAPALFGATARVPLKPFAGVIGVAPPEPGVHDVIPPRRWGGNMDARDLCAGAELWLPIGVDGALLSVGDTHAAQGDGEVCGTAIESPMTATLKVEVERGAAPPAPRFRTPGPVTRHLDGAGYDVTTGVGPDLMAAARDAVRAMVDLLAAREGFAPVEAYMLCSACADLRISEIVDAPNWVVAFYFPRIVLA